MSQGHPRTIFRRTLERGNLVLAEVTAREIGRVTCSFEPASARDRKGSRLGACDPEQVRTAGLTSAPTAKPGASRAAHGDDCRPTRPYGDCGRYLARRRRAERSHRRLACPKRQRGASPSVRKPLGSRTSLTPAKAVIRRTGAPVADAGLSLGGQCCGVACPARDAVDEGAPAGEKNHMTP